MEQQHLSRTKTNVHESQFLVNILLNDVKVKLLEETDNKLLVPPKKGKFSLAQNVNVPAGIFVKREKTGKSKLYSDDNTIPELTAIWLPKFLENRDKMRSFMCASGEWLADQIPSYFQNMCFFYKIFEYSLLDSKLLEFGICN
ncbi:DgyrCDS14745 [Dimorphilus gyrociliatus]|uniref:DgyrCDS14745 n=1 Tax=Dimorphilus gyrociliatus TaxID=2664684 RepID=A0A7I8WEV0_9ANNE|nr:DgyrCDS14745 [Dimorphilus gyrociliatus]